MTPFLQFKRWLRGGSRGERTSAAIASLLFVAFAVWAAIPFHGEQPGRDVGVGSDATPASSDTAFAGGAETSGPAAFGSETGTASGHASGPAGAVGTAAAGDTETAAGGAAATGADGCAGLEANDQGISPTEIFVAVTVVNLASDMGNEAIGLRGASELEEVAHAIAASINEEGGVACRKMRIKVYKVSPFDQNEQRAKCLEIIRDKPFAVVDIASYVTPVARSCFIEAKLPLMASSLVNEAEALESFPYMASHFASTDQRAKNWVLESAMRGTFDPQNGFRKLGMLLSTCNPKANAELVESLAKAGVGREKLSIFQLSGCTSTSPPSEISQAVLQHRNADVSHVFLAGAPLNSQSYVRQSDGVRWKPRYLVSDYQAETASALASLWSDGFDGAIAITSRREGERNSGLEAPMVSRCNQWMSKHNVRPSTTESDEIPFSVCDLFRMLAAAANAVGPGVRRTTLLAEGLPKVGRFEFAQASDSFFDRPREVFGSDFIRAIQWHLDCKCWKLIDRDAKPEH